LISVSKWGCGPRGSGRCGDAMIVPPVFSFRRVLLNDLLLSLTGYPILASAARTARMGIIKPKTPADQRGT